MKKIVNPNPASIAELIKRPYHSNDDLFVRVKKIMSDVKTNGDIALKKYSALFDGVELDNLLTPQSEIDNAQFNIDEELKSAIQVAYDNLYKFHKTQVKSEQSIETMPGIQCWRKSVAIENVGLYIPGGTAPLFSTVLMLGIPAKIAGCKNITICTPPQKDGTVHPTITYTASLLGITKIIKLGGAQAIASLCYGTETINACDKIFGPGNQYVTAAKEIAQLEGTSIDMPAGPSEVLVIADKSANPQFIAADLLAQAEHGMDSQVILVSDSEKIIDDTISEVLSQKKRLPRLQMINASLQNSKAIYFENMDRCISFSNQYAPEHLIINAKNAEDLSNQIINAGSVFLGPYSCETAGDYASGTNHALPTNGMAKKYSGVSVDSFVKKITFQSISKEGIQNLGPSLEILAAAESLQAHKNAVTIRLNNIEDGSN